MDDPVVEKGSKSDDEEEEEDEDVEQQVDRFFAELDVDQERQRRRLKADGTKVSRRRSTLPPHLHAVMGSANLSLARGDTVAASELCMEVIRQVPHVVEPFLTLATIYEDTGEKEKLLQIILIAANLKRSDYALWVKVSDLATELQQLPLAAQCLSKALKLDSQNLSLLWKRASIYQELQNWKKAIGSYEQLRQALPDDSSNDYVEVCKELARIYHIQSDDDQAITVLQTAHQRFASVFDDEAINILTELLISSRMFSDAFQVITDFYKIPLTTSISTQSKGAGYIPLEEPLSMSAALTMSMGTTDVLEPLIGAFTGHTSFTGKGGETRETVEVIEVPESLPVDLRAKLSVCVIHLRYKLPENILIPLSSTPNECGDLLLDIVEAYMENVEYSKALSLLALLVETENFSQAGVWLKHAECLHMLQELEQAAMSYVKVLSLAPHHTETRMTLASLYSQLGMTEDALALLDAEDNLYSQPDELVSQTCHGDLSASVLYQQEELPSQRTTQQHSVVSLSSPVSLPLSQDVRLLLTKFNLLVGEERVKEYVDVGVEMLMFYFRDVYHLSNLRELGGLRVKALRTRMKQMRALEGPAEHRSTEEEKALREQENLVSTEEWWKVFFKTCRGLYQLGNHQQLFHLAICGDVAKKFDVYEKGLFFLTSCISLIMGDHYFAFHFIRLLYFKMKEGTHNSLFWSLFNRIPPSQRQQKFILRLLIKDPSRLPLLRISANYSLIASSYKFALAQYELAYKQTSEDYMLCLCIAVVYANLALQKHSLHRNTLVMQSISFLHKYARLRGKCQECCYNIGRLFHQLGLVHIACQYYKKVLSLEPENANTQSKQICRLSDLKREAAFNLSLIYKASDNHELALHYIRHYCRV